MKKHVLLLLYTLGFSQVYAEIIKCKDVSGSIRYVSNETQQGQQEIQSLKDQGMTCENIDNRTPEQKIIDAKVYKERLKIENELARERYNDTVKATARFLNDVDEERKKNKRR
ncbi:MAG: hypothetical protein WCQ41_10700 [Bacillota bacterium]